MKNKRLRSLLIPFLIGGLFGGGCFAEEMLFFDYKDPEGIDGGFGFQQPPLQNGDWTKPVNYAQGRVYVRAEVISIPVNQPEMKLQLCTWQAIPDRESCMKQFNVPGIAKNVSFFDQAIPDWWAKHGKPIDWTRKRKRHGVVVRCGNGQNMWYANKYCGGTEKPKEWYPLKVRMTGVVVSKGSKFSGNWSQYVGGDGPPPSPIVLTQPHGGETFKVGNGLQVKWTADPTYVKKVVVQLSVDDGKTWITVSPVIQAFVGGNPNPQWGTFNWVIPSTVKDPTKGEVSVPSSTCRIKVKNAEGTQAASSVTFTIAPSSSMVLSHHTVQTGGIEFTKESGRLILMLPTSEAFHVKVVDAAGRTIVKRQGVRGRQLVVGRERMKPGVYCVKVQSARASYHGRVLFF